MSTLGLAAEPNPCQKEESSIIIFCTLFYTDNGRVIPLLCTHEAHFG